MIYTCTFSPSIDYTVFVDELHTGELHRAQNVYYYPGGKGINVSRMLKRFDTPSTALGFLGGFTGRFIEQALNAEYISTDFIETNTITRINVKIKSEEETEINGPGTTVTKDEWEKLRAQLMSLTSNDILVLSGRLPLNLLNDLEQLLKEAPFQIALDTSGEALKRFRTYRPYLMKPNIEELSELFETTINTEEELIHYGSQLIECGVQHLIVSLGGDGALYMDRQHTIHGIAPAREVINTVGAGDTVVAAFLSEYKKTGDPLHAFTYSVAAGSATAYSYDLAQCEQIEQLYPHVRLTDKRK